MVGEGSRFECDGAYVSFCSGASAMYSSICARKGCEGQRARGAGALESAVRDVQIS